MAKSRTLVGKTLGNYLVKEQIGIGGMGSVYLGEHPDIGRKVAIKVLAPHLSHQPGLSERFLTEAKAVARISHTNVIEIYDFSRKKGQFYYVMEYLQGQELGAIMHAKKRMSATEVWPYLEQICAGIEAAHKVGIIHRDLKPENIIVLDGDQLQLKVIDFGLVKLMEPEISGNNLTATGMVMGSPLTMAPEQVASELSKIGPATDLYAIGIIAYWMLAGRPPFLNHPRPMLMTMHITTPPPPLLDLAPWVPAKIAELVESCLAKDPSGRPRSAAEFAEGFARWADKPGKMSVEGMNKLNASTRKDTQTDADRKDIANQPTVGTPSPSPSGSVVVQPPKNPGGTQVRSPELAAVDRPPGPSYTTTLGGATGQIQSAPTTLPARSGLRWLGPIAAVSAVGLALFFGLRDEVPTEPNPLSLVGQVSAGDPSNTFDDKAMMHVVVINVSDPSAQCKSSIDGKAQPVQPPPCRITVPEGGKLDLQVEQKGLKTFQRVWRVKRAESISLGADQKKLALEVLPAKTPVVEKAPEKQAAEKAKPKTELQKAAQTGDSQVAESTNRSSTPPKKRVAQHKRKSKRKRKSVKEERSGQPKSPPRSLEGTVAF